MRLAEERERHNTLKFCNIHKYLRKNHLESALYT